MVYAPLDIRERCPDAYVDACVEISIVGVLAMWTFEDCTFARTSRTTEVADLGCVFRRNKFHHYSFPLCFVDGVFDNLASHPITNLSIVSSGILSSLWIEGLKVFEGNHAVMFFSQFNDSFADVVGNPIVDSIYPFPQSLDSFTCFLSFGQFGFEFIDSIPKNSDFIEKVSVFDEFFMGDFSVFMEYCYNCIVSETQIYADDSIIFVFNFNTLFNGYVEIIPSIFFDKFKSTDFVFTVECVFEQMSLIISTLDRYGNSAFRTIEFDLKEKGKFFSLFEYGYNSWTVHNYCEFINLWERWFFTFLDKFCIGSEYSHDCVSYLLNGLRPNIVCFSDLFIKFSMQYVFEVGFGYLSRSEFIMERVFDNVRIINSCDGLVGVEKMSQLEEFISIYLFGNLYGYGFGNLHEGYSVSGFKYLPQFLPILSDGVSLR